MTVVVPVAVVVSIVVSGVVTVSVFVSVAVVLLDLETKVCADVAVVETDDVFPAVTAVVTEAVSVTGNVCSVTDVTDAVSEAFISGLSFFETSLPEK